MIKKTPLSQKAGAKTVKRSSVKSTNKRIPVQATGTTNIAVTIFGKIKETEPMYTAQSIDALFDRQQTAIDTRENKKKLALETIKTIATLGQNSSLRETIAVVKGIGEMLQSLYEAMNKEESTATP